MENRGNMVRKWCEKNPEPKQELCPRVVQHWTNSKGHVYWDSLTGKRTTENPVGMRYWDNTVSVKNRYYGFYMRYIEKLDALEISSVILEGNRGKDGEKKKWLFGKEWRGYESRVFIFKGTTTAYNECGEEIGECKKYINTAVKDHFSHMLAYRCPVTLKGEILKFDSDGKFLSWSGSELDTLYVWNCREWYEKKFIKRTINKHHTELLSYKLSDEPIVPKGDFAFQARFELINDDLAVIRYFSYSYIWGTDRIDKKGKPAREYCRLYIDSKGKCSVMGKDSFGNWKANMKSYYMGKRAIYVNYEEMMTFKPLKYVLPCFGDKISANEIYNILRHPIIEQLIKAGYSEVAKSITIDNTIAANLKRNFGVEKEKKVSLYKLLGVNKEFLKLYEEYLSKNKIFTRDVAIEIKRLYDRDNISDLSKETLELLFNGIGRDSFTWMLPSSNMGIWYSWGRGANDHKFTDEEREFILKLCRTEQKHKGAIRIFMDAKRTYWRISDRNRPGIDLMKFDDYADIGRIHDQLVEIQNREELERQALWDMKEAERLEKINKKFKEMQDERRERFEYEEENFCVRIPKELKDIKTEGMVLGHCVGGYVDRHARGETNILFLRKRNEEDTPFYTIEICGDSVIQIHGSHNKWLGNDPEAVPFMYRYLTQLNVVFDKSMLLNKGMGYGKGRDSLPESYLTAA